MCVSINIHAGSTVYAKVYRPAKERPLLGNSGPNCCNLSLLFANLFSSALLRQSLLHSASFPRLQVVGVTFHFLDNVFRLNLALEPTQGVLQRFLMLHLCKSPVQDGSKTQPR